MKNLRIYDGVSAACLLILPPLLYTGLSSLTGRYNTAAWLVLLAAAVLALSLFLVTTALMGQHEGKHIITVAAEVMGRPAAILYGLVLGVYFSYYTGVSVRDGAEVLKKYGFSLTPLYVIAGIIILTAVALNFFGGWAIIKSAGFFFVVMLSGILLVILLGLNRYNPDYLFPVLGNGYHPIESVYQASMFDGVILLALFAPNFKNIRAFGRTGVLTLLVSALTAVLLCICYVMMFSPSVGAVMTSGFIEMGKSSYFNHFFYRFESILLFFLIFASAVQASLGLLIAKESIACVLNSKSPAAVTVICAIGAAFTVAFMPAGIQGIISDYSVFFIAGLPLLLFIISSIKRFFK